MHSRQRRGSGHLYRFTPGGRIPDRHDTPMVCTDLTKRDIDWLDTATACAHQLDQRWRIYCVIAKGDRIMAGAANTVRNDPRTCGEFLWASSEHAEAAALRIAGARARGATAYVARVGRDGKIRHAQPCIRCRERLERVGCEYKWTSDLEYIEKKLLGTHAFTNRQLLSV